MRLCNAIRKMLERHEHQVHSQKQRSFSTQMVAQDNFMYSNSDRRMTVDSPWHLQSLSTEHRKTKSADHSRPHRHSISFGTGSVNHEVLQHKSITQYPESELIMAPEGSRTANLNSFTLDYDSETAYKSSLKSGAIVEERLPAVNYTHGPETIPSFLIPRRMPGFQHKRLVQITVDNVLYCVVDLTSLSDIVSIRQHLTSAVDIEDPSFYITE